MKELLQQIKLRFISKVPKFFRWIQGLGASLSALGVSLGTIENIPDRLKEMSIDFIWIGAVIAAIAQFVVSNESKHAKKVSS